PPPSPANRLESASSARTRPDAPVQKLDRPPHPPAAHLCRHACLWTRPVPRAVDESLLRPSPLLRPPDQGNSDRGRPRSALIGWLTRASKGRLPPPLQEGQSQRAE